MSLHEVRAEDRRPRAAEGPADGGPQGVPPIQSLLRRLPFLAALALSGAVLGFGIAKLAPRGARATQPVLVAEPRLSPYTQSVDFNLTPIRSYTTFLTSRALGEGCAKTLSATDPAHAGEYKAMSRAVRARLPEQTRVIEVSVNAPTGEAASAFLACFVAAAVTENRALNARLSTESRATVTGALERTRARATELRALLREARSGSNIEIAHAERRALLDGVESATDEERRARARAVTEEARAKRLRESPERLSAKAAEDALESEARAAGARAAAQEAARSRSVGARDAEALGKRVVDLETRIAAVSSELDAVQAATVELEKRAAIAEIDMAAKAFELVPLSGSPTVSETGPPALLAALAGALTLLGAGALFVLARAA